MNYYEFHIGDFIKATAHLSMLEDSAYRRLVDAYYTREAPLPADRKACHRLARATSKAERDAVNTVLDEFFSLREDGWHQSRCDEELAKYAEKVPAAEERRENDKERQRRARERRKQLFETLSGYGINMPWNATTEQLQTELSRVTSHTEPPPVTPPVTRDNTATQTPDTSNQPPVLKTEVIHTVSDADTPQVDHTEKSNPPFTPFPTAGAGLVCKAMRDAGIPDGNPTHPTLMALIEAGATAEEFQGAAVEAVGKGKASFAYVIGTVKKRREEAAKLVLHKGRMPNRQEAIEQANKAATAGWKPPELREHAA